MKATGAEIKTFFESAWPDGHYYDDSEVDPADLIDEEMYETARLGYIRNGDDPSWDGEPVSVAFRRWKKKQTHAMIVVEVPVDAMDEFQAVCKGHGWKVRR